MTKVAWCRVKLEGLVNLSTIPAMTSDTDNSVPAQAIATDSFGEEITNKAVNGLSIAEAPRNEHKLPFIKLWR